MKTVGITGWNGFIGSHLVEHLTGMYDLYLWKGDLNSSGAQDFYLSNLKNCDVIVHLAGKNKGNPQEITKTNALATLDLLYFCNDNRKPIPLIIAGADYKKQDAYKHSKDFIKVAAKTYQYLGLGSLILNIPKVIGPGCKPFYNSFVTTLIYQAAMGQLETHKYLIKNMNEVVELISVSDICAVIEDQINYAIYNNGFDGFTEYNFNYFDGKFMITFQEIVDILEGNKNHKYSKLFLDLLDWYKNNDVKL